MAGTGYNKMFPVSWTELHRDARALAWRLADLGPFKGLVAITRGGLVPAADGKGPPEYRTFLLPRSDFEVLDTWNTMGLKGTGSNDIVVKDVFVPEYRTHKNIDAVLGTNPGNKVNTGPLFRLPFWQVFLRAVSTASIGGLQGMANAFIDYGRKRVSVTGASTARDPDAQLAIAEAKKYPQFVGNVKAVDSRDLWREANVSPKNQGYHYNRNAETYMEVGTAMGKAMVELLKQK